MSGKAPYHRGVRGSAALATRPLDADRPAAEALPPGEMRRVAFGGERLGDDVLVGRATELRVVAAGVAEAKAGSRPTATAISSPTATSTATSTPTSAPTPTPTAISSPTATPTATSTSTPTSTATSTPSATSTATRTSTAAPTPTRSRAGAAGRGPRPVRDRSSLARALAEARGSAAPDAVAAAAREVDELLAEGASPERIAACIETVRRRAARAEAKESA